MHFSPFASLFQPPQICLQIGSLDFLLCILGLDWLRDAFRGVASNQIEGVIYFADDDNTYSLELFEEIRSTHKVSVFPVGLVGGLMVEKPQIVNGKVVGWDVTWSPNRPFAIDMAGFAVNLKHFLGKPKAKFAYQVKRGHQESEFLKHLVDSLDELEPKVVFNDFSSHTF